MALTTLGPCNLVMDKRKRLLIWTDWIKDTKTKIEYMELKGNSKRLGYIKARSGRS